MVAIAETIIERRAGKFDPAEFRDRYQDALRELVEAKTKGLARTPRAIEEPPKVINLMDALKTQPRPGWRGEEIGDQWGRGDRSRRGQVQARQGGAGSASDGFTDAGLGR